jgi:hypothetical protein
MRGWMRALFAALALASLGGSPRVRAASGLVTVPCPDLGYTITLPPRWPATGVVCSAHTTVAAADRLSSVTINVYKHAAITTTQMQQNLKGLLAPMVRSADPPAFSTVKRNGFALVSSQVILHEGSQEQTAVYAESYRSGRLYFLYGLATEPSGHTESSAYDQGMSSVISTIRLTPSPGSAPVSAMGRTTLGASVSRFKADLGKPSSYTPSLDLYTWRPCSASNQEIVDVRFSQGIAYRIVLINCGRANLPNYLSIISTLLPEDAVPIGFTNSKTLGTLNLYYSQDLHDVLPSALRVDPANLHDCGGNTVAAGTLFVGQATGTIAVGLGGCETYPAASSGSNAA